MLFDSSGQQVINCTYSPAALSLAHFNPTFKTSGHVTGTDDETDHHTVNEQAELT